MLLIDGGELAGGRGGGGGVGGASAGGVSVVVVSGYAPDPELQYALIESSVA